MTMYGCHKESECGCPPNQREGCLWSFPQTNTGRIVGKGELNLQNIPTRTPEGDTIRAAFTVKSPASVLREVMQKDGLTITPEAEKALMEWEAYWGNAIPTMPLDSPEIAEYLRRVSEAGIRPPGLAGMRLRPFPMNHCDRCDRATPRDFCPICGGAFDAEGRSLPDRIWKATLQSVQWKGRDDLAMIQEFKKRRRPRLRGDDWLIIACLLVWVGFYFWTVLHRF